MRFLILIMLLSLLPISLKAQSMPHSFTDGDIIYADQINENFEYLLKRRQYTKQTLTVMRVKRSIVPWKNSTTSSYQELVMKISLLIIPSHFRKY